MTVTTDPLPHENRHERIVIDDTLEWTTAAKPASESTATNTSAGTTATATPVAQPIPERLQVLTAKSEYWATALSMERDRLRSYQRAFGYPVVIITAVTGIAAFTQLNDNPAWWAKLTVVIASAVAAVMAAVQTHQDFANRATEVKNSSDSFGALFGELLDAEEQLHKGQEPKKPLADLYAEYAKLKEARTTLPDRVGDRAIRQIERNATVRRTLAQSRATEQRLQTPAGGSTPTNAA